MVKTSIPKAIVESDFLNLIKYRIKKTHAAQLLEQWRSGNLKFTVSKTLENDGETSFLYKNTTAIKKTDLNKVSHLPTNLANPRNFSFSLFSKVRFLNCWQLSKKKGHRQVLVLQVRKQTFSKFKIAKLIFQLPLCTVQ